MHIYLNCYKQNKNANKIHSLFPLPGDLRAVNNNIIDIHHLKSLHSTIGSQVIKIVKDDEEGKFVVTFRDLNTHLEVPGYIHFDMEFDSVISCMGWKYVKPEIFDETIQMGE